MCFTVWLVSFSLIWDVGKLVEAGSLTPFLSEGD